MLPLNLSDTAATSQDGSSLDFIQAIAGRQRYIQDASGRGLCRELAQCCTSSLGINLISLEQCKIRPLCYPTLNVEGAKHMLSLELFC